MLGGDGIGASLGRGQSAMVVDEEEEKDEVEITHLVSRVTQSRPSCDPVLPPLSSPSSSPSSFPSVLRDLSLWTLETWLELVASRLLREVSSLCRKWEKYSPLAQERKEKEEKEEEAEEEGGKGKGWKEREGCALPSPGERGLLEEVRREGGRERRREGKRSGSILVLIFTSFENNLI